MLRNYNNEYILNEYIDYLMDKGKITKINDTSKKIYIKASSGIVFYFLSIVSIALFGLTIFYIIDYLSKPNTNIVNSAIIILGLALFGGIVFWVALNERKTVKLSISYPNENQIKVNNKIFDITKEDCFIDIIKKFEHYSRPDIAITNIYTEKYFLSIKGKRKSKLFQITNGTEEVFSDFIYNFEYEISDFKKQKSEFLKNTQNVLEELYDKGKISQDKLNKIKDNKM